MSDPLSTFISAYQCLYESSSDQSNDAATRQSAHTWLLSFQSDPAAWTTVDRVLNTQSINAGCHYLAATILLTKIRYHFADLSTLVDARLSLRQSIIGQIQRFQTLSPSGNQSIISRLSLCLAALSVREMADGLWETCIADLTSLFLNQPNQIHNGISSSQQSMKSFLSVLKEIPEEAHNIKLHMADAARENVVRMLQKHLYSMFDLLWTIHQSIQQSNQQSADQSANAANQQLILECLSSWLKNLRFDPLEFINHPISVVPFAACLIDQLMESAEECCMEIIERSTNTNARDQLYTLLQPLQAHHQANYQEISRDRETGLMFTKLLCTFAETDVENIAEILGNQAIDHSSHSYVNPINHQALSRLNVQSVQKLLESILYTCLHEDKDIAAYSFKFWTDLSFTVSRRMQDALYEASQQSNSQSATITFSDQPFMMYFIQVVQHVQRMVLYPDNFETIGQSDKESLQKYRYLASETLKQMVQTANQSNNSPSHQSISFWLNAFDESLRSGKSKFLSSGGKSWQSLEAALHCFRAIGGVLHISESTVIPQVMDFILGSQTDSISINQSIINGECPAPLSYTCLLVVSKYADWIAAHQADYLSKSLQLVVQSLNQSANQAPAAVAFKNLCEANDEYMIQCINQLSNSQSPNAANNQSIYSALFGVFTASTSLHMDDQREIIGGVCHVVSKLNTQSIGPAIKLLIEPTAQALDQAIAQSNSQAVDLYLDRLSDIYAELRPSSPLVNHSINQSTQSVDGFRSSVSSSTIQIYPVLTKGLQCLVESEKRMEKLCRILKYAFKNCPYELRSLFDSLIDCLIDGFERFPYSAFVYLIATLMDLYGTNNQSVNQQELHIIQRGFSRLGGRVVQLFNSIQPISQSINQHPDVLDDFMDLCHRLLIQNPQILLESTFHPSTALNNQVSSQLCPFILQLALAGLSIQHPQAFNQSCRFLSLFFDEAAGAAKIRMARTGLPQAHNPVQNQSIASHFAAALTPSVTLSIVRAVCYDQPVARQTALAELAMSVQLFNQSNKVWYTAFETLAAEYASAQSSNAHWIPPSEAVQYDFVTVIVNQAVSAQQLPPMQAGQCQRHIKQAMFKMSGACRRK